MSVKHVTINGGSTTAVLPCATYSRVSTDDQVQAYGLTSQRHELRELARRKGYPVAAELADEGVSGATLDRPALTQLRDGVRDGRYRVVLVHAPDRLARTLVHQLVLLEEFKRAGARVEFLTTPAEDSAEGRLLLNVSGVIAEFEREKIRERTLRGKREKARRGLVVTPRNSPFGYAAADGRWLVDDRQAAVVRLAYALLIDERRSVRGIVAELNRRGLPSARGPWNTTQLRRVLSDERYIGRGHYGDIVIPIPAIVTPAEHAAARAQLDRNRAQHVGRPAHVVDLLKGLLRCAACGYKYRGAPTSGRRRCYKHDQDRARVAACTHRFYFSAKDLEANVRAAITAALQDPAVLRQGVEAYETRRGATDVELRSRVAHLERQIIRVRQDERRLIALVVGDREQQDLVEGKLRELARERAGVAEQLRTAEAKVAQHGAVNRTDAIEQLCAQARRGLARLDGRGWRALVEEIVDEILVLPDRSVEIHGLLGPSRIGPGVKESV
jgi:site-specific DNA recombinase